MTIADAPGVKYFLILNCCRSRTLGTGNAILPQGSTNVAIAFASSAREVAFDGRPGKNCAFTGEILRHLNDPKLSAGVTHERLFGNIRAAVEEKYAGSQVPDLVNQISGYVVFRPDPVYLRQMLETQEYVDKLSDDIQRDLDKAFESKLPLLERIKNLGTTIVGWFSRPFKLKKK